MLKEATVQLESKAMLTRFQQEIKEDGRLEGVELIGIKPFTDRGWECLKLQYAKDKGPNLEKSIIISEIAERIYGFVMFTKTEVEEIRDNAESCAVFKDNLEFGELSYIRDPEFEGIAKAAFLCRGRYGSGLSIPCWVPDVVATVGFLKKTGSEADAPKLIEGESGSRILKTPSELVRLPPH